MRARREAWLLFGLVCQLLAIGSPAASNGAGRRQLRWSWNPPMPPLPAYPCPRTQVPATPKTLWIDGNYTGTVSTGSPTQPFKTLVVAWKSLPAAPKMQQAGVTFNIRPGVVLHTNVWSPLEKLWGTAENSIVFQRDPDADPALGPAIIHGELVMTNSSYIYFRNILFRPAGAGTNAIRASSSDYMYFLNVTVAGIYNSSYPGTSQALKVYNSRAIYVEDSDVFGTAPGGWALTFINVQYGHVCRSQVHHADWCFGLTGGSGYMLMDGNNVHHCGQAALVSGLYGGYATPAGPWLNYDAYNIKVTNNIVHDVWGAGLSVWGGYNILLAHNTLYKVGSRSHTVEIQLSTHGCSSTAATCAALNAQGAWVPLSGAPTFSIPTKDVMFLNNLIVNPANESAKWSHFATSPLVNYTGANVPATLPRLVTMREGLIIKGNVFVNRHLDPKYAMGLGLDPCYNTGLPCDKPTVYDTNLINTPGLEVSFTDPETLVLTDTSKAALSVAPYKPATEVPFEAWSTPVDTPVGVLSNEVPVDRTGVPRGAANDLPGAYYDPNYQPAKFCAIGPDPAWAPNSTTGWPAECGRVLVGSVCTAACGTKATGTDYTVRCDDSNKWTHLGGGCDTKSCASAPSPYLAPNSAGWDPSCAGALFGATCTAGCGANATGTAYTARCDDTNTWTVISGACQGPPWQPATPPLPSYPCPRTQVPAYLTPKVLHVDPAYTGPVEAGSAVQPFKTFVKAWMSLGKGMLTAGVTINIRPGTALSGRLWMDNVWGTPDAPLVIQRDPAANPLDPPSLLEVVDIFNCTHMYFRDITFKIQPPGDGNVVHLASCSYVYLLNVTIAGIFNKGYPGTNQALKVNQVQGLYVEDSDISGSAPNGVGLDGVSVRYGHVCRSHIHHADWCMYLKGGSAYFIIDSNTVHACGQAGLEVGQGTGFEFMTPPWLEYEGYGMKLTNNVIYDVWGAGLGVNGGYSILIAHNTMYRVGSRSHTVEFNFGGRGCGGSAKCVTYYNMGGWGPALSSDGSIKIPTKDVMFLNNIVVNPSNESAMWCHFAASSPIVTTGLVGYGPTMPNPVSVTEGLIIKGNVFVNRHLDPKYAMSLGLGQCDNTALPCNSVTVKADNLINAPGLNLSFTDPEALMLTDESKAALRAAAYKGGALVPFAGWATPQGTPQGQLSNEVPFDRNGLLRTLTDLPGAWV